jgi:hypothetical protein
MAGTAPTLRVAFSGDPTDEIAAFMVVTAALSAPELLVVFAVIIADEHPAAVSVTAAMAHAVQNNLPATARTSVTARNPLRVTVNP